MLKKSGLSLFDISTVFFRKSLGPRDNESRLYLCTFDIHRKGHIDETQPSRHRKKDEELTLAKQNGTYT